MKRPAIYLDATLPAGGTTELAVPADFQGFAYLLDGSGAFGSNELEAGEQERVVVLGETKQSGGETSFPVRAGANGVRFVLRRSADRRNAALERQLRRLASAGGAFRNPRRIPHALLKRANKEEPLNHDTDRAGTDRAGTDRAGTDRAGAEAARPHRQR